VKEMFKSIISICERTICHIYLLLICWCYQQEHRNCRSDTPSCRLVHWTDGTGSTKYL